MATAKKFTQAIATYRRALALAAEVSPSSVDLIRDSIGAAYVQLGNAAEAEKFFLMCTTAGAATTRLKSFLNLASLAYGTDKTRAGKFVEKAESIADMLSPSHFSGHDLLNLARLERDLGSLPKSVLTAKKAKECFLANKDRAGEALVCRDLGDACFGMDDFAGAKLQYSEGIELLTGQKNSPVLASLLIGLGTTQVALKSFVEAEQTLTRAKTIAAEIEDRKLEEKASQYLVNLKEHQGRRSK